jgi:UrcA family protein
MSRILATSLITSLAILTALANAAHADPAMIRRDVKVTYQPAELSTEAGARALLAKLDIAAKEACGASPYFYSSYPQTPGLAQKEFKDCHAEAMNRAVGTLNAPMVLKLYAKNGEMLRRIAGR